MPASQLRADREAADRLGFYRFLNRLRWPRTYLGRLLVVCAVALSAPLFVSLGLVVLAADHVDRYRVFAAVAAADIVGIGLMLVGLRLALEPVRLSVAALDAYQRERRLPQLPGHYDDEPGRLMRQIHRTIMSVESAHADLLHRAETDPLTEIANRRLFLRRGVEELVTARRTGEALSLVILDIDRFKSVNDTYGHAAGDMVLRLVAGLLARTLRGRDALARIGGEEFAILLPATPLAEAVMIAERLRHRMTMLPIPLLDGTAVTASFGVAATHDDDTDIETVMHRADMALYDAKRGGRNCVAYRSAADGDGEDCTGPAAFPIAVAAVRGAAAEVAWIVD